MWGSESVMCPAEPLAPQSKARWKISGTASVWLAGILLVGVISMSSVAGLQGAPAKPKLLRHVVLFKFKDTVTPAQIQEVADAFAALPGKIKSIVDFEWGTDVSVENKNAGMTHGFLVTFKSTEDRDAYLPDPDHQEFVKLVGPRVADVIVFDYWVR
jgi:hypothetical protein